LLSIDLRQSIRIHGRNNAGLDIDTIKIFAIQMFIGLHAIRKNKLIHADIKPDNILVSKDLKTIKYCDFGTAFSI
jgi:serine/threonine-protein kinase PRP4